MSALRSILLLLLAAPCAQATVWINDSIGVGASGTGSVPDSIKSTAGIMVFDLPATTAPSFLAADPGGNRFYYIPDAAALRSGSFTGTNWTDPAVGQLSAAFGEESVAISYASFVVGRFNAISPSASVAPNHPKLASGWDPLLPRNPDPAAWVGDEALFIVGNGTSETDRANALTILKDGQTGIGLWGADLHARSGLLVANGAIESAFGGFIFPDGSIQATAATTPVLDHLETPDGSNLQALVVDNAAQIGIGTTTPAARLHVVGTTQLDGDVTFSQSLSVGGDLQVQGVMTVLPQGGISMGEFTATP